jgi:hypothetical protein
MGSVGFSSADSRPGGGLSIARVVGLNATGQIAKASGGRLYGWQFTNTGAAVAYVKIYNLATAPTSATVPVITIPVAATSGSAFFHHPIGIGFSSGISVRAVTGVADNDNTGAGTNEVIAQLFYS